MIDYSNVRAVCFDCARKAGFVQKKKAVIVFEDECGICKARGRVQTCGTIGCNQKRKSR